MIRRFAPLARFAAQTAGTAAVEFALLVPMLVILMFGGSEAGHFVWTQHKLVDAVRDGARFASRLRAQDVCTGATSSISSANVDAIKLITRTGQLASTTAHPVVPGWTAAQVTVTVSCRAFVSTGIYADYGEAGPVVTVQASGVTYPTLFGGMTLSGSGVGLSAKSSAAVIGI